MLTYCRSNGTGIIPWSPLAAGELALPVVAETVRCYATKGALYGGKLTGRQDRNRVEEVGRKSVS